jgi:hypothetical protein
MRKLLFLAVVLAVIGFGCQPKVLIFNVQPSTVVSGPAKVTVHWKLSAGTGEISADQPVKPALVPKKGVDAQGSMDFEVCQTTTFKIEPHYGGERTTTVKVNKPCGSECGNKVLTFTGTCQSANQGPTYDVQNVSANIGSVNLQDLQSDADFPVHVLHLGSDIALGANGGPVFPPVPPIPAAGDYTINIPGLVGQQVCADATSPVGGSPADAPVVHVTVFPACAKP